MRAAAGVRHAESAVVARALASRFSHNLRCVRPMAIKKYLSLQEAAEFLGISQQALVRARERGEIRGFADRGSWKFRLEDVEEYGRMRQPDSDPEVPLLKEVPPHKPDDTTELDAQLAPRERPQQARGSDSSVVLGSEEDEAVGDQPTVIRRKRAQPDTDDGLQSSDSDVRLVLDERSTAESEAELPIPGKGKSDSDVRLADELRPVIDAGSDSDVKLVASDSDSDVALVAQQPHGEEGSDSDVKLVDPAGGSGVKAGQPRAGSAAEKDSDSDVKLVEPDSDSDVRLVQTSAAAPADDSDSDVKLADSDSDVRLLTRPAQSASEKDSDSDVKLAEADSDSDVKLLAASKSGPQAAAGRRAPPPRTDSDVRVVADAEPAVSDTDSEVALVQADSDSDVKLLPKEGRAEGSDSDVRLVQTGAANVTEGDSSVILVSDEGPISDSDVQLMFDGDAIVLPEQDEAAAPAAVTQTRAPAGPGKQKDSSFIELRSDSSGPGSTSDVQPISDDAALIGPSSDSDVQLIFEEPKARSGSDSDVRLIHEADGSDSDVALLPEDEAAVLSASVTDSDHGASVLLDESEVNLLDEGRTLAAGSGVLRELPADSGISLESGDSGISLELDESSGLKLAEGSDSGIQAEDSGIRLAGGSSIILEGADSGISLESADSGIALDAADSGISFDSSESGISLESADSGIALESADSGIALLEPTDSGIALESADRRARMSGTVPELDAAVDEDNIGETQLEVPSLSDDESDFEIAGLDDDDQEADDAGEETSVILFDDEDADDYSPTVVKKSTPQDEQDLQTGEGDFHEFDEFDSDDLEEEEEVVAEDDDAGIGDVFDAEADEDFDDTFQSGESHAEFVAPVSPAGAIAAPIEVEWGAATFVGLLLSTAAMVLCTMVVFDLVLSMWAWRDPVGFNSVLLDLFGGLFTG